MSATSDVVKRLREPWQLGGVELQNRVLLAPLAGIGNWFVRLQARRYGAGFAYSEMVSSFAIKYRNERTCTELLRISPEEGPIALQLFGHDPEAMYTAAAEVAKAGASIVDINMGCPVPKVCKTGAGAALLEDPTLAVELAVAAREGSGLPVTVKLRPGRRPGQRGGVEVAHRLATDAGVAGLTFHPRHASQQHKGTPDYALARELIEELDVPVILSGGMSSPERVHSAFEETGAAAVMLARGSLGNPWLFQKVLGYRDIDPTPSEVFLELDWVIDCAVDHMGTERAGRYLRKFYPWYLQRLGAGPDAQDALQRAETLAAARLELVRLAAERGVETPVRRPDLALA